MLYVGAQLYVWRLLAPSSQEQEGQKPAIIKWIIPRGIISTHIFYINFPELNTSENILRKLQTENISK